MPTGVASTSIAEPQLFGLDVDRFLLAAVRAVADQAFANDMCIDIDFILSPVANGCRFSATAWLRGITSLQIKAAERKYAPPAKGEAKLRATAK